MVYRKIAFLAQGDVLDDEILETCCIERPISKCQKTLNSSVIRQKGESQNGCYKKTKYARFSEKRAFPTP